MEISKYLKIPFLHEGRSFKGIDCYGLVLLFYRLEFDIILPDYNYEQNWCMKSFNWIETEYYKYWERIEKPVKYCLAGFKLPGRHVEHHLGIMMPDLIGFLHIPAGQMVCVDKLTNPVWKRSLRTFYKVNRERYK